MQHCTYCDVKFEIKFENDSTDLEISFCPICGDPMSTYSIYNVEEDYYNEDGIDELDL